MKLGKVIITASGLIGMIILLLGFYINNANKDNAANPTDSWKMYKSEKLGMELRYPQKLTLSEQNGVVVLNHHIPYENQGNCDMMGEVGNFDYLTDFNVTFEIKPSKIVPSYMDGKYEAGLLKGIWQYEGAEGCGQSIYYFYLSSGKTLVVKKEMVQALSGISTIWNVEEIMKVPGVIDREESERLFRQILSTIKFNN